MRLRTALILGVLGSLAFGVGYWWRGQDVVVLAAAEPAPARETLPVREAAMVQREEPPRAAPTPVVVPRKLVPPAPPQPKVATAAPAAAPQAPEEHRTMKNESWPERWTFDPAATILAASPGVASLGGQVVWSGPVPSPAEEHRESDSYCRNFAQADDRPPLATLNGGVRDAVVWLVAPVAAPRAPSWKSALVSFEKCSLEPRVQVASVGQVLEVVNDDQTLHNLHAYLSAASVLSKSLRGGGPIPDEAQTTLEQPGVYIVKCDIHPWERATVVVTSAAPAMVTSTEGFFAFDGVPPGLYTLGSFEERTGISNRKVQLPAGRSSAVLRLNQSLLARR